MASTPIITATTEAVDIETFVVNGPFWLYGDDFAYGESATVMRPRNSGEGYIEATNENGPMRVTANPNTVYCDLKAGTYGIKKTATGAAASVSFDDSVGGA